jgi:hypothetical protein
MIRLVGANAISLRESAERAIRRDLLEATGAQVPSIAVRAEMARERGATGKAPLIVSLTPWTALILKHRVPTRFTILATLMIIRLFLYVPAGPPAAIPLIVFVWGGKRGLPVHPFHIVEQAFDVALNPARAKIAVTMHVLNDAGSLRSQLWVQVVARLCP